MMPDSGTKSTGTVQLPRVSVVIPTYNNLSLLLESIDSIQKQNYPREQVEVVVVDNASTDRTSEIVRLRFPLVKVIKLETNTGFAVACNRGALDASGEYIAFLNNDAVADSNWLSALVSTVISSGDGTVCFASRIVSRDGTEVEYDGASSNMFGAGRPTSVWGWADAPEPPKEGRALLFASGGAMLIERAVFLEVGGFDPAYFAYFEDVDLGWRLWILGYRVVYSPEAVVRHVGGATGKRSGEHRRYVLWESNSLATILKNYESANMPKILTAALLLEYKRALMAAVDAFKSSDYHLGGAADLNRANVERLPKVSVAHLVAIDRFNSLLPKLMESRRNIQAKRVRSDAEIIPLLGGPFEPQFAGRAYAEASQKLVSALDLYGLTRTASPNRVLILAGNDETREALETAEALKEVAQIAVVLIGRADLAAQDSEYVVYYLSDTDPRIRQLLSFADLVVLLPRFGPTQIVRDVLSPLVTIGQQRRDLPLALTVDSPTDSRLLDLCRSPRSAVSSQAR